MHRTSTAWSDVVEEACQSGVNVIVELGRSIRDKVAVEWSVVTSMESRLFSTM